MIGIVDLGCGNLASIANMYDRLGHKVVVGAAPDTLAGADRLILPGVGSFDRAARALATSSIRDYLNERVLNDGVLLLGICLGMQLLGRSSEEGDLPGLGFLPAEARRVRVPEESNLRIPHMGWNTLELRRTSLLFDGSAARYFFVHSYAMVCDDRSHVLATTNHGTEIVAAVQHRNILGVQFHPEKSHRFGMELLNRFATADAEPLQDSPTC